MRFLYALLILTFSATALLADKWPSRLHSEPLLETRFGLMETIITSFQTQIDGPFVPIGSGMNEYSFDGERLKGLSGTVYVTQVLEWGDKGDVILLRADSGGSGCCTDNYILHVDQDGHILTPRFASGGHTWAGSTPYNFSITPQEIRFRMSVLFPRNVEYLDIGYDGIAVEVTPVLENDAGVLPAGSGNDVTRWSEDGELRWYEGGGLFNAPDERARFRQIMTDEELLILRHRVLEVGTFGHEYETITDGFLLGRGAMQRKWHSFSNFGYFAIEVETGRPFAAYWLEEGLQVFGGEPHEIPAPMLDLINFDLVTHPEPDW